MKKEQVVVERTYKAPIQQVWAAITEPDQMKQWYLSINDFRAEVGFETSFDQKSGDKSYPHIWKVTEVVPGRKISYAWSFANFPGNSEVTFELTPEGNGTRLTLTHTGLESFGDYAPVAGFEKGWTYFIGEALPKFLEKVPVS